jgi:mycothiol system anti-sigma-R factor
MMVCAPDPDGALGEESTGDDCADVMLDVWRFLDNELDPERRAVIQRHLDDCSPCLEEAGIDTKLKQLLALKCGGDHAPSHLRERIVTQLVAWRTESSELSTGSGGVTVTSETVTSGTVTSSMTAMTSVTAVTSMTLSAEAGPESGD